MKNDDEPEKLSEEAERLIEILDIPTPQALIDIEDLLSPLQKQTYEENNSLTQNDRNDAETATEKDIQFELGNLDKEFDNSATPESTIRVRHPDDSPTTPESMVSRRQNVPGGWGDQYQDYVPDRYQNNAPSSDRNGLVWSVVFVLTILDIAVPLSLGLSIPGPETLARFYNICLQPTTAIDD
ncbi:hypothetical protein PtrSN002B_012154, partial [Pyrenophora tritici-repentis]